LRSAADEIERALVIWAAATVFVLLFNSASGTAFENATDMLVIWTLLLLPSVVPIRRPAAESDPSAAVGRGLKPLGER
jgi:hypothetical protein